MQKFARRTLHTPSFTPVDELRTLRVASAFQHHAHLLAELIFFQDSERRRQ
jgi:hypothetical protein